MSLGSSIGRKLLRRRRADQRGDPPGRTKLPLRASLARPPSRCATRTGPVADPRGDPHCPWNRDRFGTPFLSYPLPMRVTRQVAPHGPGHSRLLRRGQVVRSVTGARCELEKRVSFSVTRALLRLGRFGRSLVVGFFRKRVEDAAKATATPVANNTPIFLPKICFEKRQS